MRNYFTRWDQIMSTELTNEITVKLALWCLDQVDSDVKGPFVTALNKRDYRFFSSVELDYSSLSYHESYYLRQCAALFSKRVDIDLGIDREQAGYAKFVAAEEACRQTNMIFKCWSAGNFMFPRGVDSILYRASRKISSILGDVPELSTLTPRFGPGATTQVTKQRASARRKLSQTFACSEEFVPMASLALEQLQGWIQFNESDTAEISLEIHEGKLNFVPKTALVSRAICVEPMLNTMFQLGIDQYMRGRLKRFGIDLSSQERNKNLARIGSLTKDLATLDLSSASDMISIELVYHLLPIEWVFFLKYFRTPVVEYQGNRHVLEKFSSMGNGFTFPLESLIFYALAISCVEEKELFDCVSVYGDDIIIPVKYYDTLVQVLTCCGFSVNKSKSFKNGPFRESCGGDYYEGIDIRPVYLKDRLSGFDAFRLHNFFSRNLQPELANIVLDYISEPLRIWGPDGFGDGHLITDAPPYKPHNRHLGWSGYTFDTFTFKNRRDFSILPGDRVLPSYTIYASGPMEGLPGLPAELYERFPWLSRRRPHYNSLGVSVKYGTSARRKKVDTGDTFGVVIPGTKGYKRISIYTLSRL